MSELWEQFGCSDLNRYAECSAVSVSKTERHDMKQTLSQRLDEQATEIATLRTALNTQFIRIARMQAELDMLPAARERREQGRRDRTASAPASNGNGHRS
jgi:hypothetical protein